MGIAVLLHVLAVIVWVGGMFFAYMALRPVAASQLEAPVRLKLWVGVFGRFFPWVWVSIVLILASGFWMILAYLGGFAAVGLHIHIMLGLGILMMLIFFHVFFAPYKHLKRKVVAEDWSAAGRKLGQIRLLVGVNTILGLVTAAIGAAGNYFL